MKKYELTTDTKSIFGKRYFGIRALVDFGNVSKGDLGGYIESEDNLSNDTGYGNAWVGGEAYVGGDARVVGEAYVDSNDCYTTIKRFGTEFRNTTFFRCKDNKIRVQCGCFYGDLEEFRQQVKDTRGGKIAKEYLMVADLMEYHFSEEK